VITDQSRVTNGGRHRISGVDGLCMAESQATREVGGGEGDVKGFVEVVNVHRQVCASTTL
jgi:hypothetical protein